MSKKCCGIIYSDEDEICRICGKALIETPDEDTESMDSDIDEGETADDKADVEAIIEAVIETSTEADTEDKAENNPADEPEDRDEVDESEEDEEVNPDKASGGHIAMGIISILLAVAGLALIGFGVYRLILFRPYVYLDKGRVLTFPEISTDTDASATEMRDMLVYAATATDANTDTNANTDNISTNTDAEASDDSVEE